MNQFLITLSSFISHTGQVGISFLAVLANHTAVVVGVLPQETLGIVVTVDVDLCQSIVGSRFLTAFMNTGLKPGKQQLQPGGRNTYGFQGQDLRRKTAADSSLYKRR